MTSLLCFLAALFACVAQLVSGQPLARATPTLCNVEEFKLTAGQFSEVGNIYVSRDSTLNKLYVSYVLDPESGATMTEAHMFVKFGEDNDFDSRLPPGQAKPYVWTSGQSVDNQYVTFIDGHLTFVVDIPEKMLETCPASTFMYIQAHAKLVWYSLDGGILQEETAYGGTIVYPKKKAWYGTIKYEFKCDCDIEETPGPEEECLGYQKETAWAAGDHYNNNREDELAVYGPGGNGGNGNWAMFVTFVLDVGSTTTMSDIQLLAGQHYEAGTVTIKKNEDGTTKITVEFAEHWGVEVDGDKANFHVKGYAQSPAGPGVNPAPGQLDYKVVCDPTGENPNCELTMTGHFAYYGIHMNVQKCITAPQ